MKALDFSHDSFFHYEYYYQDLLELYASLPSTTTQDFWKDTKAWLANDTVSYSSKGYYFRKERLSYLSFIVTTIFLTSSVTLLNDLTGGLASSHVKCY